MLSRKNIPIIIVHILFWTFSSYFFITYFTLQTEEIYQDTSGEEVIRTTYNNLLQLSLIIGIIVRIAWFYGHIKWIVPFLTDKKYLQYFGIGLTFVSLAILLEMGIAAYIYDQWYIRSLFFILLVIYIFYTITSMGVGMYSAWQKTDKAKTDLKQQLVSSELKALKSQFDPHFVFNTLNSLLFIAEKEGNSSISSAIEKMATLMRSVIYDFGAPTIPIEKEIELIDKYIGLQMLKYDDKDDIKISFKKPNNLELKNIHIAPLLLLPFIENAFKHGIDIYSSSYIDINLQVKNGLVRFVIRNINNQPQLSPKAISGIGLKNIKKRLHLLYQNRHSLKISADEEYVVELEIQLRNNPKPVYVEEHYC